MSMNNYQPPIGVLFSGGLDSAVMVDWLLARHSRVVPFYVRTGRLWESSELTAVHRFLAALSQPRLSPLVVFDLPLGDLYGSHWSMTGAGVPDDASSDEAVFMPGHNPLLLIKPVLWCQTHAIHSLAMAILAGNPFKDSTAEFFARFEEMMRAGTGAAVRVKRPFQQMAKVQVMELGRHLPLEHTFSCLAPEAATHCGRCNKCAERRRAFAAVSLPDPTRYANAPAPQAASGAAV